MEAQEKVGLRVGKLNKPCIQVYLKIGLNYINQSINQSINEDLYSALSRSLLISAHRNMVDMVFC